MGKLLEKRIITSRTYYSPESSTIPPYDYDITYPRTVYQAVMRGMDENSGTLDQEIEAIYRLISEKQETIDGGIAGQIMTWTGVPGEIGSMEILKTLVTDTSKRSHKRILSEKAIEDALDAKLNEKDFNEHTQNENIHISETDRARWNNAASSSMLQYHISDDRIHVTATEKAKWNNKADLEVIDSHINNINNPHQVTAHQTGAYTRHEIDEMLEGMRESFFNYKNIAWDERTGSASLVQYHESNWNPNYILAYSDPLPDVENQKMTYFALRPATDYTVAETSDCVIYIKRPDIGWQEVGIVSMSAGDMVITYPDTTMYVWIQGRFLDLFGSSNGGNSGAGSDQPSNPGNVSLDSPVFTGKPRVPLAPSNSNDSQIASTQWVRQNAVGVAIGECKTTSDTMIKVVELLPEDENTPTFVRRKGSTVVVIFSYDDKSATPTTNPMLDVQGTGAATIIYGSLPITNGMIKAGYNYTFTFDGTNWRIHNPSGIHSLPDSDNSNAYVSSEWVRRNIISTAKGTCTTDGNEQVKVATIQSELMSKAIFRRQIGSTVLITFTNDDQYMGGTKLNVNDTGVSSVTYAGKVIEPGMIAAGHTHIFTFDGTNWILVNPASVQTISDADDSNRPASTQWVRRNIITPVYGECVSESGNPNKVATLKNSTDSVVFKRLIGAIVTIKFAYEDKSGTNPTTLNVDNSGAAPIIYGDRPVLDGYIGGGHAHTFVFDGENWQLINPINPWIWTNDGLTIGPGTPNSVSLTALAKQQEVVNINSGHTGFTTSGEDGEIDDDGCVDKVWISINYTPRSYEPEITVAEGTDIFAAQMGDGTTILLNDPVIVSKTQSNCIIQFTMDTKYPSNSPCQLIYRTNDAWINIKEITE